jgi:hypothetical protein
LKTGFEFTIGSTPYIFIVVIQCIECSIVNLPTELFFCSECACLSLDFCGSLFFSCPHFALQTSSKVGNRVNMGTLSMVQSHDLTSRLAQCHSARSAGRSGGYYLPAWAERRCRAFLQLGNTSCL